MGKVVSFSVRCPGALSVTLAGDFNNWNESSHPMVYDGIQDVWTITLPLEPGRYEYKFFVDGRVWWNDPLAPKVPNVWGVRIPTSMSSRGNAELDLPYIKW
jgi:1,4-alpha-glucan branching enzyme